jgi:hypothetical protein
VDLTPSPSQTQDPDRDESNGLGSVDEPSVLRIDSLIMTVQVRAPAAEGAMFTFGAWSSSPAAVGRGPPLARREPTRQRPRRWTPSHAHTVGHAGHHANTHAPTAPSST